jgi:hypothetical protein
VRAADRWKLGRLSLAEVRALDATVDFVDVGRALGYGRESAYAERKRNDSADGQTSSLGGVPLTWRGRGWVATQVALLRALDSDERVGGVA